jgi:DNA invertase Pin-like site-specific DNA recombinase
MKIDLLFIIVLCFILMADSNYDNIVCHLCDSGDNENVLMLCDGCSRGFHTYCLGIPFVPPDDWFCIKCVKDGMNINRPSIGQGTKVVLYQRVSSKGQNEPQYGRAGIETQNHALLQFCQDNNLYVVGTYRDIGSAYNRPWAKLSQIEKISNMKDICILVYSVSRFSRNLGYGEKLLLNIHSKGSCVYSVTEKVYSYDDKFYSLIQEAEKESEMISRKVIDSNRRIRNMGGWIGKAPYGYNIIVDDSGIRRLVENTDEQAVIRMMNELAEKARQQGTNPISYIKCSIGGFRYRDGKEWTTEKIKKVLDAKWTSFSKDMMQAIIV